MGPSSVITTLANGLTVEDPALPWTFTFVAITFMAYLYIGWQSRVKESAGFYVAGKGIPAIANGAATAADWMSAASFIGMAGLIASMGSDGSVYLMGWTGGYVLLALLLAPYLRKFGKYTVPDFVGARYYSETARIVAAICAIFVSVTYVAGQMKGVGVVFSRFLSVDLTAGVIVGMFIVAFFAVLGGMKGITWTQVMQYCILIVAFLVPAFAIAQELTGNPIPQLAFTFSQLADDLNREMGSLGYTEAYTQPFTGGRDMVEVAFIAIALMFGTAGLPHVIVRFYTVKSVRAARWSAFWALLFIAVLYTTAPAVGMFARYNLIKSLHGATVRQIDIERTDFVADEKSAESIVLKGADEATRAAAYAKILEQVLASKAEQERAKKADDDPKFQVRTYYQLDDPTGNPINWAYKWQFTDLLNFDDLDRDGSISLKVADGAGNPMSTELIKLDKDIIVLSTPEVAGLAPWVIALVAAGGLAAALSTAAGLLLVISSSMAHDLYIHFFDPKASEAKRVMVGRVCIVLAILVAGYFGINPPGFVAEVVAFAFGLAAASFFPAIFLGIFDKRTNRAGAVTGMIVGLAFTGIYILGCTAPKIIPGVETPWFGLIANPDNYYWCFGLSPKAIGTVGMILNFIVTLTISHLTAPPPPEVQALVESVRVPRGSHDPEAHFAEEDSAADNP